MCEAVVATSGTASCSTAGTDNDRCGGAVTGFAVCGLVVDTTVVVATTSATEETSSTVGAGADSATGAGTDAGIEILPADWYGL
jgi:hypothetical protein